MSIQKFEHDCEGCEPALLDTNTGKVMTNDHPVMQAMNKIWAETDVATKTAFHDVCCLNSREPAKLKLCQDLMTRVQLAAGLK